MKMSYILPLFVGLMVSNCLVYANSLSSTSRIVRINIDTDGHTGPYIAFAQKSSYQHIFTKNHTTFNLGIGQKYYLGQKVSNGLYGSDCLTPKLTKFDNNKRCHIIMNGLNGSFRCTIQCVGPKV